MREWLYQRWVIVFVTPDSTITPTLRLCADALNQRAGFAHSGIIPCQTELSRGAWL